MAKRKGKKGKGMGTMIDELYARDELVRKATSNLAQLKRERAEHEAKMLKKFNSEDLKGAKGSRALAMVTTLKSPTVKNFKKMLKYIKRHNAFDLLQRRIASQAYFARLEEGEEVPGVEVFERDRISVRKRK